MNKKEFKLLIENFNRFLLKEHLGHSQDDLDLFNVIPDVFKDYINEGVEWYSGENWMVEVEHDSLEEEEDQKLLFEEVAKACGCSVKDLLVTHEDPFSDSLGQGTNMSTFLNSYRSNGTLCGSFELNGVSLKGFHFSYGTGSAQFRLQYRDGKQPTRWPRSSMSETLLKGLIFVAPNFAGGSSSKPVKKFKSSLGSAW